MGKFNIGDRVRVLEWREMEDLYGIDPYGDIDINHVVNFTAGMKHLCGVEATIISIDKYCDVPRYYFDNKALNEWIIVGEMIEIVQEPDNSSMEAIGSEEFFSLVLSPV